MGAIAGVISRMGGGTRVQTILFPTGMCVRTMLTSDTIEYSCMMDYARRDAIAPEMKEKIFIVSGIEYNYLNRKCL